MISVEDNNVDLLKANWKFLIILDACRYDIFRDIYKGIIHNHCELKRAITYCSGTKEWLQNNFHGRDCSEIVYVDPIIMFDKFLPNHNFFKVDYVWKTKWNYEYYTILAKDITDSALEQLKQHPDKRFIVHYHQPHPPFLSPEFKGMNESNTPDKILRIIADEKPPHNDFPHFIQGKLRNVLGSENTWKLLIRLGIEPLDFFGRVYKLYGTEGIIRGYIENLRLVLSDVTRLINKYNGKIIISADHSKNLNGSSKNLKNEYVPWLEIEVNQHK